MPQSMLSQVSRRTWSQCMYSVCLPFFLSCVFGTAAAQRCGMERLRTLDKALAAAFRVRDQQGDSPVGKELRALLNDIWFWQTQLCLEIIQEGRASQFNAGTMETRNLAFSCFAGVGNSKYTAEDVFAHLQHVAARSQKGSLQMNKWSKFFYCTTAQTARKNGIQPIRCLPQDYSVSPMQKEQRYGMYFRPSTPTPPNLELSTLEQASQLD